MMEQSQRTGDAVREIMDAYSGMVYRLAYARTGNRADADDVYQEVFFKLFRTKPRLESEAHLKAWLIRTAIHTSVNLLRSAWRRHVRPLPDGYDAPDLSFSDDGRLSELRKALMRLPEKQRIVIHLYYYEQLSTEEIAELLGEKGATVRSRMKRGRERLRSLLTETEVE